MIYYISFKVKITIVKDTNENIRNLCFILEDENGNIILSNTYDNSNLSKRTTINPSIGIKRCEDPSYNDHLQKCPTIKKYYSTNHNSLVTNHLLVILNMKKLYNASYIY